MFGSGEEEFVLELNFDQTLIECYGPYKRVDGTFNPKIDPLFGVAGDLCPFDEARWQRIVELEDREGRLGP